MLKTNKDINDVNFILDNLRKEDKEEIIELWGDNWKDKFIKNTMSTEFLILTNNNIPIAMGGIVSISNSQLRIACVWLLCSVYVKNHKILLLRTIKKHIDIASSEFDILYNYIYKLNFEAKKWLKNLGFKFDNPSPPNLEVREGFEFFYKLNR